MAHRKKNRVDLKSQVCFAESLFEMLILDIASGRPPVLRSSLLHDLETLKSRLNYEGIQFCTITLPSLAKAIYKSFQTGKLVCPSSFKKMRGTTLPRLFSGLLKEIYTDDGVLRNGADTTSITEVLQLCGLGYKLDVPFNGDQESQVINRFVECEDEISKLPNFDESEPFVLELARSMIAEVFSGISSSEILPKHGPGSVATKERGYKKWRFSKQYPKLHKVFPTHEYFVCGQDDYYDQLERYENLEVQERGLAAVVLVPKDSRGPRLISMEPLDYQFIQQGIWKLLKRRIEMHPFTRRRVNFDDQTINQDHAIAGSIDGSWATLDMKDASDRVSLKLVRTLFRKVPQLLEWLEASRSDGTILPDGRVVELQKFAPMGSATCFPVESVVHYVLAVSSIAYWWRIPVWEAIQSVLVFGDDLVIHRRYASHVMQNLSQFGLMFNVDKSYIDGPFRESCGVESFKGINVTPIRWRKPWSQHLNAVSVQAFCDFASLLYKSGYCRAAERVWRSLEKQLGSLPTVPLELNVGYLTRKSRLPYYHTPYRIRKDTWIHDLLHKAIQVRLKVHKEGSDGWEKLLQFLLTGSAASTMSADYSYLRSRWLRLRGAYPYQGVGALVAVKR